MKKPFPFLILTLLALSACGDSFADQLRDGDIIFHTSRSAQSYEKAANKIIGVGFLVAMVLSVMGLIAWSQYR